MSTKNKTTKVTRLNAMSQKEINAMLRKEKSPFRIEDRWTKGSGTFYSLKHNLFGYWTYMTASSSKAVELLLF
jgi:hypothetical protein